MAGFEYAYFARKREAETLVEQLEEADARADEAEKNAALWASRSKGLEAQVTALARALEAATGSSTDLLGTEALKGLYRAAFTEAAGGYNIEARDISEHLARKAAE